MIELAENSSSDPQSWKSMKGAVKNVVTEKRNKKWSERISMLVKQGSLLQLLEEEQSDLTWKSIMYGMPRGILSFATRAAIDSLPTPQNLKLWGKRLNGNCSLCNCKGTLAHILNMCTVALQQGRLTYRHSVLRYVVKEVKKSAEENGMQIDYSLTSLV